MLKRNLFFGVLTLIIITTTNLYSQDKDERKYLIRKGQFLHTTEINGNLNLKPYKKSHIENYNGIKTEIIEIGDYVFREDNYGKDTLNYKVTTYSISQGDTLVEDRILELKKKLSYDIKAQLEFNKDRILIYQLEDNRQNKQRPKTKEYVHPTDKNLYYKLSDEESFKYESLGVSFKIIGTPAKIRFNSKVDSISTAEFQFNNIGLFLGFNSTNHKYKNGKLKKRGIAIGPYISFSSIKLNNSNTLKELEIEKNRLGIILGAVVFKEINNFNIGIGLGVERLNRKDSYEWIYNKKAFMGLFVGYTIN